MTNCEPTIDGFDGGIGARVNLMSFMNKFVEKPDPNYKNLKDRLGSLEYKLAFFDILEHIPKLQISRFSAEDILDKESLRKVIKEL